MEKCTECQFENGEHAQTCSHYVEKPAPVPGPTGATGPAVSGPAESGASAAESGPSGSAAAAMESESTIQQAEIVRPDPTKRQTGKEEVYAYTLKDKLYGDFKILNSANAWWLDPQKVRDLLQAYKIDCTDEEACAYAGISLGQLRYFSDLHEDFLQVKLACKQLPILRARKTVVEGLEKSSTLSQWYLERKRKDEFSSRSELTGPNGEAIIDQTRKLDTLIHDVGKLTADAAAASGPAHESGAPAPAAAEQKGDQARSEGGSTGPSGPAAPTPKETGPEAGPTGPASTAA